VVRQVQSLGAEFLELSFPEDGTVRRLHKVMSDEFIKAEMALFAAQATEVDIIIDSADPRQNSTCADHPGNG